MNSNDHVLAEAKCLAAKLATLVGDERKVLVAFLRHLIEFDQKCHYAKLGHGSLFTYCTDELRLSIGSTSRRMTAARLMARFPVIADFLADGRLSLVSLSLLKNVLTQENHLEVLREAGRRTEKEVEVLVATLQPKPDTIDSIRKLPRPGVEPPAQSIVLASPSVTQTPSRPSAASPSFALEAQVPCALVPAPSTVQQPTVTSIMEVKPGKPVALRAPRMEVHPTSASAYSVKFSASHEFIEELKQVRAALSHKFPNGRIEDVLRECFRITLEAIERRRCGSSRTVTKSATPTPHAKQRTPAVASAASPLPATPTSPASAVVSASPAAATPHASAAASPSTATPTSPAPAVVSASPASPTSPATAIAESVPSSAIAACGTVAPSAPRSRYIPTAVRRAVWKRDGGSCAFVSAEGKRCGSRHQVQFHHLEPFATGGPSTVGNLGLRCRIHNHYEAVVAFGAGFMASRIQGHGHDPLADSPAP